MAFAGRHSAGERVPDALRAQRGMSSWSPVVRQRPNLSPKGVQSALQQTAKDLGPGDNDCRYGSGLPGPATRCRSSAAGKIRAAEPR